MKNLCPSLALIAAALLSASGVNAAIVDLVDPFDQIRAFVRLGPGLEQEDIDPNVPFGTSGAAVLFGSGIVLLRRGARKGQAHAE